MSVFQAVRNRPSPYLLPFLLVLLVAAAPARKPAETFEGSSHVVAVEVPVNVSGRDGEPVRGLKAGDFEVYDGNDRQTITSFEIVDLKATIPAGTAPADERQPDEMSASARRRFLFLFDLSFSSPTSILKARLAARDLALHSLHPADLAAVATYSLEAGPKLVITFTPDRAQLVRAIDTLGFRQVLDMRMADPLRFMIDTPASALSEATLNIADNLDLKTQKDQAILDYLKTLSFVNERSERSFEVSRIAGYSRALGEMAKALNSVKGRKHILYFSEGFDSRLLLGRQTIDKETDDDNVNIMFGQTWMVDNDARYGNTGLQGNVQRMLEEFRRADCVIEAVDIGGLRAAADQSTRPSGQEGLFYLANETGGELFKDANNLRDPLERVLERTSVTYLLTFERSDLKLDGSYHRLRVKAANLPSGARLAHRTGYYAPRPFKELDPLEKNLLASDGIASAAPKRDIDLNVLAAPFRASAALSYVPVIVEIGGRSLLEGQAGSKLNLEIYSYVSNSEGQMKDFFSQRVDLDLGKDRGRQSMLDGGVKYYGHFDLPPGDYHVRVLVRNAETGRTGVQTARVEVPAYGQAQAVLLPPFFMEDRQKWLLVRENSHEGQQASVVYPFTVEGQPYVPSARPTLRGESTAKLCLVAYNLGKGEVSVQGKVMAADGTASAGHLSKAQRTATGIQGLDKLVATFDPAGLNAGNYVLQVAVTDPTTGHLHASSLPFQVVH
ncbi:MAG TPA: VWA domain-containing protein [Thermoanaerobaculia bacterium]|jgi:VWFA-related protein|nr:VWA domain-containing protein [Thermoanaerobaculia bacterium]